ncbi:CHAT domain-containing protein [Streptosporangium sp. NPDC002721]|uniref:CHAT domain-containing protein n=1 Tax=Streptosporangium sp. NPDC002721 TaxID=3366188 RepID=UPI0036B01799
MSSYRNVDQSIVLAIGTVFKAVRGLNLILAAIPLAFAIDQAVGQSLGTVGSITLIGGVAVFCARFLLLLPARVGVTRVTRGFLHIYASLWLIISISLAATPLGRLAVELSASAGPLVGFSGGLSLAAIAVGCSVGPTMATGITALRRQIKVLFIFSALSAVVVGVIPFMFVASAFFHPNAEVVEAWTTMAVVWCVFMILEIPHRKWHMRLADAQNLKSMKPQLQSVALASWLHDSFGRRQSNPDLSLIHVLAHHNRVVQTTGIVPGDSLVIAGGLPRPPARGDDLFAYVAIGEQALHLIEREVPDWRLTGVSTLAVRYHRALAAVCESKAEINAYLNRPDETIAESRAAATAFRAAGEHDVATLQSLWLAGYLRNNLSRPADALAEISESLTDSALSVFVRRTLLLFVVETHLDLGDHEAARLLMAEIESTATRQDDITRVLRSKYPYAPSAWIRTITYMHHNLLAHLEARVRGLVAGELAPMMKSIEVSWSVGSFVMIRSLIERPLDDGRAEPVRVPGKFMKTLLRARDNAVRYDNLEGLFLAESSLAYWTKDPVERHRHLTSAIHVLNRIRGSFLDPNLRIDLLDRADSIYADAARNLVTMDGRLDERWPALPIEAAFELSEAARSRVLLELLGENAASAPPPGLEELVTEEVALAAVYATERRALRLGDEAQARVVRDTGRRLDLVRDRLAESGARGAEYVELRQGVPARLAEIRRLLADGLAVGRRVVLVEYLCFDDVVIVFGASAAEGQPEVRVLPFNRHELNLFLTANFGARHRVRDLAEMGLDDLWHAWDYLVEPIAQWAEPGDIVYLVPHNLLHYMPLHALKVGDRFLIDRNPVAYCQSASTLRYCTNRRRREDSAKTSHTVAVFGDSRGDLPAARAEAEALGELFQAKPVIGTAVTRDAFRGLATSADIVHIAGHAHFDVDNMARSGILLSGDDILTSGDIIALKGVRAELVALSGCETGINENRPGDELIGLTRALLYAGAASVLVSLWEVADDSTEFLMRRFYQYYWETGINKADALRQAIVDTRAVPGWAGFYHWAPFTLVGDWR